MPAWHVCCMGCIMSMISAALVGYPKIAALFGGLKALTAVLCFASAFPC